jgi:hypothetical protein
MKTVEDVVRCEGTNELGALIEIAKQNKRIANALEGIFHVMCHPNMAGDYDGTT